MSMFKWNDIEKRLRDGCRFRDGSPSNKMFHTVALEVIDELQGQGFSVNEIQEEADKLRKQYDEQDDLAESMRPCNQVLFYKIVSTIILCLEKKGRKLEHLQLRENRDGFVVLEEGPPPKRKLPVDESEVVLMAMDEPRYHVVLRIDFSSESD
ncbi:hypothetical protein QBC35DRAFT_455643 [Podospora australis]|uniref:Uncharacterized protein n=1 Tax=Podospora australis TaxID=1536484 RepID=A0AAN6WMJ6_9PEZI|nr:hypothetical protein QBC35DRAFT_455643 [Podospora australis]